VHLTQCHLNIYSRNTPTLFLGYTNIYLLQDYIGLLFVIHNKCGGGGEEGSSTVAELMWQLCLYDKAFLTDLKSFVIGVMKKTAGLNNLSM
jgi:hypothetical protein